MQRIQRTTSALVMALALGLPPGPAAAETRARPERPPSRPAPAPARSQSQPPPTRHLSFEDDVVQAGREGGAGEVVAGRTPPRLSRLIPVRTSFVPEMIKSAEDL